MLSPKRRGRAALIALLVLASFACTETDPQIVTNIGSTQLYVNILGIDNPTVGNLQAISAVEVDVEMFRLTLSDGQMIDFTGGSVGALGCVFHNSTRLGFSQSPDPCEDGLVLPGDLPAGTATLDLAFSGHIFRGTRDSSGMFPPDFSPGGDADGDGVLNGADACPLLDAQIFQRDPETGELVRDDDGNRIPIGDAEDVTCGKGRGIDLPNRTPGASGEGRPASGRDGCENLPNGDPIPADQLRLRTSGAPCTTISGGFFTLDSDGDEVADNLDNCPFVFNPGQENFAGTPARTRVLLAEDPDALFDGDGDPINLNNTIADDRVGDACSPPGEDPLQGSAAGVPFNFSLSGVAFDFSQPAESIGFLTIDLDLSTWDCAVNPDLTQCTIQQDDVRTCLLSQEEAFLRFLGCPSEDEDVNEDDPPPGGAGSIP